MAKHKAATEVTIAPTTEESALQSMVNRYWPHFACVALAGTAVIVWAQWSSQQEHSGAWESWSRLGEEVELNQGINPPSPTVVAEIADELVDTPAGAWAKVIEVGKRLETGDVEGVRRATRELEELWPDHVLATQGVFPRASDDGPPRKLADHIEASLTAMDAWEKAHPSLFSNPPLPEGAPRVRITTTAGDLVIGLYEEQAPEHAANFLKLCGEGFYDGIKFHRVMKDFMIQAGDPNSRDEDAPETWGQGGPGYTLEPEVGELWHFPNAVASAAVAAGGPTSGSQFYIVTGEDQHHLDGDYTVFGVLLEGESVATEIENGVVLGDRPEEPVEIVSTTVL